MLKKTNRAPGKIRDIAEAAGVSSATVSRVFSRHPYVAEELRERVLRCARELNYAPHISSTRGLFGLMLDTGEGFSIGGYLNQLMTPLARCLAKRNYLFQIITSEQMPYLHRNSFRGIVLLNRRHSAELKRLGIPGIIINDLGGEVPSVITDHSIGPRLAVRHLTGQGHRRLALLRFAGRNNWGSDDRESGFRAEAALAGLSESDVLVAEYSGIETIEAAVQNLLKQKPTGLIVDGEGAAGPAYQALFRLGVKIPDELSLILFENAALTPFLAPPATSIEQDFTALAECAADLLIRSSAARKPVTIPPVTILSGTRLIVRESVRNLASPC